MGGKKNFDLRKKNGLSLQNFNFDYTWKSTKSSMNSFVRTLKFYCLLDRKIKQKTKQQQQQTEVMESNQNEERLLNEQLQ